MLIILGIQPVESFSKRSSIIDEVRIETFLTLKCISFMMQAIDLALPAEVRQRQLKGAWLPRMQKGSRRCPQDAQDG